MSKYIDFKHFISIIAIYLYIYAPPFQVIPFGIDKIFTILSFMYITYKKDWPYLIYKFKNEFVLLSLLFFWAFFIATLYGKTFILMAYDLLLLIQVIPCSYALYRYFEQGMNLKMDRGIINAAILGSLISFYLILNPESAFYFKSELLKYPENLVDKLVYRGYGLSDGLLFSYPVIQGFSLSFILLGFYRSKAYYFFILFLFVSIIVNARSGFVPILVAIMILLFYNFKNIIKILIVGGVFVLLTFDIFSQFLEENEMLKTATEWSMTSFEIIEDFFSGKKTENVDVLLSDMIIWPEDFLTWIIGSGNYLFTGFSKTTDIGYLLRLNYGGVIYILIFIFLWLYMALRLYRINKIMTLLLFLSLLYLNFKGDFFIVNPASRFFFLIYVICVLNHNAFKKIVNSPKNG